MSWRHANSFFNCFSLSLSLISCPLSLHSLLSSLSLSLFLSAFTLLFSTLSLSLNSLSFSLLLSLSLSLFLSPFAPLSLSLSLSSLSLSLSLYLSSLPFSSLSLSFFPFLSLWGCWVGGHLFRVLRASTSALPLASYITPPKEHPTPPPPEKATLAKTCHGERLQPQAGRGLSWIGLVLMGKRGGRPEHRTAEHHMPKRYDAPCLVKEDHS